MQAQPAQGMSAPGERQGAVLALPEVGLRKVGNSLDGPAGGKAALREQPGSAQGHGVAPTGRAPGSVPSPTRPLASEAPGGRR